MRSGSEGSPGVKPFLITLAVLILLAGGLVLLWWLLRRTASDPVADAPVSPAVPASPAPPTSPAPLISPVPLAGLPAVSAPATAGAVTQPEAVTAVAEPDAGTTQAEPVVATTTAEPDAARDAAATAQPGSLSAGPYGPGSAAPLADGTAPSPEFTVKGNAGSKLFHGPESPYYKRTRAEAWFRTAEDAAAAGFRHWDRRRREA